MKKLTYQIKNEKVMTFSTESELIEHLKIIIDGLLKDNDILRKEVELCYKKTTKK